MSGGIEEKIKKLLALSENNPNPHEAAAAAAMAAELALRHNIEMAGIRKGDRRTFHNGMANWHYRDKDDQAMCLAAQQVARLYGTVLTISVAESTRWVCFTGDEANIQISHSWMKYLWDSCLRGCREHAAEAGRGSAKVRQMARESYRLYFCAAVATRLREKREAMRRDGVAGSTALVVAGWYDQERAAIDEWMKEHHPLGEPMKLKDVKILAEAALAGKASGERVGLSDQIKGRTERGQIRSG